MSQKIYLNRRFVDPADARISVYDHGFLYGDGVFEGIRAYSGRVFRLQEHVERLYRSARSLMLEIPLTQEEFCEVVTWVQLGIHRKPCGILNIGGYYDSLLQFFDHAVAEGFLRPQHREMLLVDDDPATLVDRFATWEAPAVHKWIDRTDT